ncbi:MAG: ATP-binding protein, partial [Selenomonadaceae bacterium]|nr:ATP-binding protein [Selenomonadaceae bacterium]
MWSIFPNLAMFSLNNFAKISGAPHLPLYSILAMTVSDIVLDILLVHQGMLGLGLATTFGYVIGLGVSCLYFRDKKHSLHFVCPRRFLPCLMAMMRAGLPTAAVRLGEGLRTIMLNHMLIVTVGAGALAALNVRTQANNFFGAVALGMSQSLLPVVGLFYGQEDRTSLKETLWYSIRRGIFLNFIVCIFLCLFAKQIASMFGIRDDDVMDMAVLAILLLGISLPLRDLNCTLINCFQATKRASLATVFSILQTFVLVCVCSAALIDRFSETGVWIAFLLAEVVTFVLIAAYVWVCRKRMPRSMEDLMLLKDDFGETDQLEISVKNTIDDVVKAVDTAMAYAEGRGIETRKINAIGLMIEEVGTNIVRYAFEDKKDHWLDIFMLVKRDEVRLHFRDNGKPFDPIAYSDSNEGGIGLKLVRGLTQDIEYSYNLILNELRVKL